MSADAISLQPSNLTAETADFCLSPEEVSKGEKAVLAYLDSLKAAEGRKNAEEALDILAAVISGGVCGVRSFPWQQVRAYHGALALSIVKQDGAPTHVETLRCRSDETRRFREVPSSFAAKQVQRMASALNRVIAECTTLGFISEEEALKALPPAKSSSKRPARGRTLSDGEVRALLAACGMDSSIAGARDSLMICLAYQGGLKTVDLVNLSLKDLHFEHRTGKVTLKVRQPQGKRAKRIPLENEELIALEDWLEARGRADGPLFCPILRGGKTDTRRTTAAEVRELCERRAAEAGLDLFAPNDLARSSALQREATRRQRGRGSRQSAGGTVLTSVSPLFDDEAEQTNESINFPYRGRGAS